MLHKYRHILLYALSLGLFLLVLQFLEYKLIILDHAFELYITLIAVIFTGLGIWLAMKLTRPKVETRIETVILEKEI